MALTPNFSASQTAGFPSKVTLTDTSTGSDGLISSRRVLLQTATGTYLVQSGNTNNYEVWSYANSSIVLTLLDKDYALTITVQFLNASNVVLYSKSLNVRLTLFSETFDYGLTSLLAYNSALMNESRFWEDKERLRALIDSGNNAVDFASDITSAQICYDEATKIRTLSQYNF